MWRNLLTSVCLLAMLCLPTSGQETAPPPEVSDVVAPAETMVAGGPFEQADPAKAVTISTRWEPAEVRAGEKAQLIVVLTINPAFHLNAYPASMEGLVPTSVIVAPVKGVKVGKPKYPTGKPLMMVGLDQPVKVYTDKVEIAVPIIAKAGAIGPLAVTVNWQACTDEYCEIPDSRTIDVGIPVVESAPTGDEESGNAKPRAASGENTIAAVPDTWWITALLGILGGFVLNLTPCVLSVIPIKILTLTQHAGSRGRTFYLGAWMALGVVMFWVVAGLPMALISTALDPSRIFGIWWLTVGIGVIIGIMGAGIMGLFLLNLPQAVYKVNPKADTPTGSFIFGVMTAVLGLPCFGFVAGALLAAAASWPWWLTMVVFASLGVGMALPYLILAGFPGWLERIPRTGPASELVKQVMGLLLMAAAAYFIGSGLIALVQDAPYIGKELHWWAVALLASLAGLWLIVRTFAITPGIGKRTIFTLVGLFIAGAAVFYAITTTANAREAYQLKQAALAEAITQGGPMPLITTTWMDYTPGLPERALAEGKIVVMDFTAAWCLNCKALKAAVLNVEPVKSRLAKEDVVSITVDLTSTNAPGWTLLRETYKRTGIPLLVVLKDGAEPWLANGYTSGDVINAIDGKNE